METRPIRLAGGALLLLVAGACSEQPPGLRLTSSTVPHFSVRGRQPCGSDGRPQLRVHIDGQDSPLESGVFQACVQAAMESWNATELVHFELAADGTEYDVLCAWRSTRHDACPAFGQDTTVAHSGPVEPWTFVHFDRDRDWSADGSGGLPLTQVATHELGHVLGLGHSLDEGAVMHANHHAQRLHPAVSDLAGLAALYGGLPPASGDLWLESASASSIPILQRIAPIESTGVAAWDVDGNGRDDLLLWRTDPAGMGQLMVYHFDEQRRLTHSSGPMVNCVVPGAHVVLCQDMGGAGVLLSIRAGGRSSAKRFQGAPNPQLMPMDVPLKLPAGYLDADHDGWLESLPDEARRVRDSQTISGDLDGDGLIETLNRLP